MSEPTKPSRRKRLQLRFDEGDYQEFVEMAMREGYIQSGDVGKQAKVKAAVERMMISKVLGRKSKGK